MRVVYLLFLLAVVAALGVFAWQNYEPVTLRYLGRSLDTTLPVLLGAVYLLGMVSGWTVLGLLKRSAERVTEHRSQ